MTGRSEDRQYGGSRWSASVNLNGYYDMTATAPKQHSECLSVVTGGDSRYGTTILSTSVVWSISSVSIGDLATRMGRFATAPTFTPQHHTYRSSPQREKLRKTLGSRVQTPYGYVLCLVHQEQRSHYEQPAETVHVELGRLPKLTLREEPADLW